MRTATATQLEAETRPAVGLYLVEELDDADRDATQGREIGSDPFDDATRSRRRL